MGQCVVTRFSRRVVSGPAALRIEPPGRLGQSQLGSLRPPPTAQCGSRSRSGTGALRCRARPTQGPSARLHRVLRPQDIARRDRDRLAELTAQEPQPAPIAMVPIRQTARDERDHDWTPPRRAERRPWVSVLPTRARAGDPLTGIVTRDRLRSRLTRWPNRRADFSPLDTPSAITTASEARTTSHPNEFGFPRVGPPRGTVWSISFRKAGVKSIELGLPRGQADSKRNVRPSASQGPEADCLESRCFERFGRYPAQESNSWRLCCPLQKSS